MTGTTVQRASGRNTLSAIPSWRRRRSDSGAIGCSSGWTSRSSPNFRLASGLLTGKYRRGEDGPAGTRLAGLRPGSDRQFEVVEGLRDYAEARGIEMIDVAIGGLAAQPAVASVIAGATKPEQVRANVAAARWEPSEEDLAELDRVAPSPRR